MRGRGAVSRNRGVRNDSSGRLRSCAVRHVWANSMSRPRQACDKNGGSSKFDALMEAMKDATLTFADCRIYGAMLDTVWTCRGGVLCCRPSRERLAKAAGLNRITVTRSTQRLSKSGYISVAKSKGRNTNVYTLLKIQFAAEPSHFPNG